MSDSQPIPDVVKALAAAHFADASALIAAYDAYITEQNLTMCMMGSLEEEIKNPAAFYNPARGGIFLAYAKKEANTAGKAVGICCFEEHHPQHPTLRSAEIRRMYVAPEGRGQRIGEALISACINEAERLGYQRVVLDTFQEPTYALKLYKRMGFTECDPFNHLPLDKAVWLEKML